jgi:hypothetical protein
MDGLKLYLQQAGRKDGWGDVQNYFYNGWTHDHYVSNLFLFSPDGKIRKFFVNAPGCWHDSTLANASGIYDDLDKIYHAHGGAQVVVDSAFSKDNRPSLVKSHQTLWIDLATFVTVGAGSAMQQVSVRWQSGG